MANRLAEKACEKGSENSLYMHHASHPLNLTGCTEVIDIKSFTVNICFDHVHTLFDNLSVYSTV